MIAQRAVQSSEADREELRLSQFARHGLQSGDLSDARREFRVPLTHGGLEQLCRGLAPLQSLLQFRDPMIPEDGSGIGEAQLLLQMGHPGAEAVDPLHEQQTQ